jgi:hypothetical protein
MRNVASARFVATTRCVAAAFVAGLLFVAAPCVRAADPPEPAPASAAPAPVEPPQPDTQPGDARPADPPPPADAPPPAEAPPPAANAIIASAIPAGTPISGRLSTDLDTGKTNVGDGFSLALTRPFPNDDPAYSGAFVRGHVARVIRAGQGRKPELDLAFDSITLASGETAPLTGHVLDVTPKKKSAIVNQAAGAGVGMIVGNIIGKSIFHTDIGGLAGATGGFVYANNRKTDFVVPAQSIVELQTDSEVPRPQARR